MNTVVSTVPPTRITLLDGDGVAVVRWTLQMVEREGRSLRWKPEGKLIQLGSGTNWTRFWDHHGFRMELGLRWAYGVTSSREAREGAAWASAELLPTAQAHSEIIEWGLKRQVQVEPFMGTPMPAFRAQATEAGPSLQDTKGIAHPKLELVLASIRLVRRVVFVKARGGWGLGPWGLMPWGY